MAQHNRKGGRLKKEYATFAEAEAAAQELRDEFGDRFSYSAYNCGKCGSFHAGRSPRSNTTGFWRNYREPDFTELGERVMAHMKAQNHKHAAARYAAILRARGRRIKRKNYNRHSALAELTAWEEENS